MKHLIYSLLFVTGFLFSGHQVSAQTCFITKSGTKYHKATCSYLRSSAIALKLSEANHRGYTACSRCRPNSNSLKAVTSSYYTEKYSKVDYAVRSVSKCSTAQCSGKTQKGRRCRNRTKSCTGKCHHHQ